VSDACTCPGVGRFLALNISKWLFEEQGSFWGYKGTPPPENDTSHLNNR
jgi:hypothetical protein